VYVHLFVYITAWKWKSIKHRATKPFLHRGNGKRPKRKTLLQWYIWQTVFDTSGLGIYI